MLADLLAARLNIAFDHQALDQVLDVVRMAAAVQNLFRNADLLLSLIHI